jgi:hypothetical protein
MPPQAPAAGLPKGAGAPMHQSREAHHPARPHHAPEAACQPGRRSDEKLRLVCECNKQTA